MKMDPTLIAMRGSPRPMESSKSWSCLGAKTGAITTISANAPVFQFENISSNLIAIRKVSICFTLTTAFSSAQYLDFGVIVIRSISALGSSGTAIVLSGFAGNNCKLASEGAGCTAINARISTTGAITTGTRTQDTNYLGQTGAWLGAIGATIPLTTLFDAVPGDYPLLLAANEGIEISPLTAMGSTGVGYLGVNLEFAEIPAASL